MQFEAKKNILFCGTLNKNINSSWDKTNSFLFDSLSKISYCYHLDYSINNKYIKKIYKLITRFLYKEVLPRNPLNGFLEEKRLKYLIGKINVKPHLIIHSSTICIPGEIEKICPHVLYTDATVTGAVRYNGYNPDKKALELFVSETRKYISRAKFVFTFNEWTRESLINEFGIEKEKVINIGFGANLDPYSGPKNYSNGEILIVLRRGLEKNKGLLLLLDAFRIAHRKNPKLHLSVVGTTLESIPGVTYYEGYPREKTIELFRSASLYAMPALFEPNGMVYIEALASKTPTLGLNRLAYPEFSGNGKYGFITDNQPEAIADVLVQAFKDVERLKKMGEEGQQFVLERYSWDIVTKKILDSIF